MWSRVEIIVALAAIGCGEPSWVDPDAGSGSGTATATLRDGVHALSDVEAALVVSRGADTWVLQRSIGARPQDVLLLDDSAVRVVSVIEVDGRVVLTVSPAEIDEVFAAFDLEQELTLDGASFMPEPEDAARAAAPPAILAGALGVPFNDPPFSGELGLSMTCRVHFHHDLAHGASGGIDVIGAVDGTLSVMSTGKTPAKMFERKIGTIRIPISVSIIDAALRFLGVRLAAIYVPVSLGAEAKASYGIGVRLSGHASETIEVRYDQARGFSAMGPRFTGSYGVEGTVPDDSPDVAGKLELSAGAYLRARPQLLILNQVASIGADVKAGPHLDGTLSVVADPPSYCFKAQAKLESEVFAFFKATGGISAMSPTWPGSTDLGPPFTRGNCPDLGPPPTSYVPALATPGAAWLITSQ